ncbi:SDR family NAD(P)-dependent oxidoreductase [Terrarubrum flagellatum]|uniref:SDR family NAD(P)-dependent oxidoreductase n=1 Tax=Terrirubrum flagellatum TaxID=2895980 RepID=UPI0031454309
MAGVERFVNRKALVTGAASGIARAVADRLAREGAQLALADRDEKALRATCDEIAARYGRAPHAILFEAADHDSCRRMVDEAATKLGALDVVLNIAGVYGRCRFEDISAADWARVMDVNLNSLMPIIQAALPHLIKSGGNIVNTSSLAGVRGIAYASHYAAAKAGVIGLSQSLAGEFGPLGVRVNVVCPGGVNTPMTANMAPVRDPDPSIAFPKPKLRGKRERAEPQDLAGVYAFLASDDACFVSGAAINVDGAQISG